jgi:uncharacterized protein
MSKWVSTAFLICVFSIASWSRLDAQESEHAALDTLTIQTSSGPSVFHIEVMRSDEERERGLMYRRFMPADRGMLFDFKPEQTVMMWMKNTYISLDMLFISRDGHIVNIAENTEPLSERIIPSAVPVAAVLEINAGTVARLHIHRSDQVIHPMFRQ